MLCCFSKTLSFFNIRDLYNYNKNTKTHICVIAKYEREVYKYFPLELISRIFIEIFWSWFLSFGKYFQVSTETAQLWSSFESHGSKFTRIFLIAFDISYFNTIIDEIITISWKTWNAHRNKDYTWYRRSEKNLREFPRRYDNEIAN